MAVKDYTVDEENQVIVVEWERELLAEKPTRLVSILPGDTLGVRDLYGRMVATVGIIKDWGPERGVHVYLDDGGIVTVRELLDSWTGCWL